jgi:hypothetical protein
MTPEDRILRLSHSAVCDEVFVEDPYTIPAGSVYATYGGPDHAAYGGSEGYPYGSRSNAPPPRQAANPRPPLAHAGPLLAHVGPHAAGIDDQPAFKNVTDAKRDRYLGTIQPQMQRRDNGILKAFDTKSIKDYNKAKYNGLPRDAQGRKMSAKGWQWQGVGAQRLSGSPAEEARVRYWSENSLIWVCAPGLGNSATFYSHIGKMKRFHHSSFTAGQPVLGAGEWVVENGHLKAISANSGHYQPTIDHLRQSILHMREALHDDTTVLLWSAQDGWTDVPVQQFLNQGDHNGRYRTHPAHQ